eukprot:9111753-Alexandrium_andersonii.AAC.1
MSASLVGSEMCIRDSSYAGCPPPMGRVTAATTVPEPRRQYPSRRIRTGPCLLYTSDAADDM